MITARFKKNGCQFVWLEVSGHAGYADKGDDIVCAAVTSSVQLALNIITDVLCISADVKVLENRILFSLHDDSSREAQPILEGLHVHLNDIASQYPAYVRVIL